VEGRNGGGRPRLEYTKQVARDVDSNGYVELKSWLSCAENGIKLVDRLMTKKQQY
jgi:hypothetical protein